MKVKFAWIGHQGQRENLGTDMDYASKRVFEVPLMILLLYS